VLDAIQLGVLVITVSGLVLWLVFRSADSAHWVGRLGDAILNWLLHFFRKPKSDRVERAVLHFRDYFPPIFIGIVTYLWWKRGLARGTHAKDPDVRPSPAPAGG
jgi:hypothetical protein